MNQNRKTGKRSRRFYFPISLAAMFLFLAVIFIFSPEAEGSRVYVSGDKGGSTLTFKVDYLSPINYDSMVILKRVQNGDTLSSLITTALSKELSGDSSIVSKDTITNLSITQIK